MNVQTNLMNQDAASVMAEQCRKRLQARADDRRVEAAIYAWLKRCDLVVQEEGVDELISEMSRIVRLARAGDGRPSDAEVRASLEASNRFRAEHNALPNMSRSLPLIALDVLGLVSGPD